MVVSRVTVRFSLRLDDCAVNHVTPQPAILKVNQPRALNVQVKTITQRAEELFRLLRSTLGPFNAFCLCYGVHSSASAAAAAGEEELAGTVLSDLNQALKS